MNNKRHIIGFTGKSQAGKTLAAKALVAEGFTKIGFKDALIQEVADIFQLVLKELHIDTRTKEWWHHPVVRALVKNHGTELRRAEDKNYWINRIKMNNTDDYVIDDVRFVNESKKIKRLGGIVVRVVRNGCAGNTHASEAEQDEIVADYIIENNGTDTELKERVLELLLGLHQQQIEDQATIDRVNKIN